MTGFSDSAFLVGVSYGKGENGREAVTSTRKRVFVNPFTVAQSAYQDFGADGSRTRATLQMRACDYAGEEVIEYHGETLAITGAQPTGRGEMVRLTCAQKAADDD